jgi:hypothetical protein
MPKSKDSNASIESRIQLAIFELENIEKPNIKEWACAKNLPYQRLLARYKGRPSLSERPPNGRKLDNSLKKQPFAAISRR